MTLGAAGLVAAVPGSADAASGPGDAPPAPPVAVASSLRFAWPSLLEAASASPVRTSFGASLALAGQMLGGAPFELLVAADEASIERLVRAGLVAPADAGRYADGTLSLAVRADSPLAPAPTLEALATLLDERPAARIAIANPTHAPYGRAALEALASAGLGELSPSRVARGESAAQALQYLLAGAVDAALVPRSLVVGVPVATPLAARRIEPGRHAPIRHALALTREAGPVARALGRFLRGCAARATFDRHGLGAPAGVACTDPAPPR